MMTVGEYVAHSLEQCTAEELRERIRSALAEIQLRQNRSGHLYMTIALAKVESRLLGIPDSFPIEGDPV